MLNQKKGERAVKVFQFLDDLLPLGYQSLDANGRILDVNQFWLDKLGYSRAEVIGRWFGDFISPEHAPKFNTMFSRFKSAGEIHNVEFDLVKKDGSKIMVLFNGRVEYDEKGRFKQTHCYFYDITEQKQAKKELEASQERFKILFEYAPDAYYLNDMKGNFLDSNKMAEKITGYKREELIGKNFLKMNLFSKDQLIKASKLLAKNALGKSTGPDGFTLKRKDGSKVMVDISTHPVKIMNQRLVLGIARDITKRKKAEEEIRLVQSLTMTISSSKDLQSAMKSVLEKICISTGWIMGESWMLQNGKTLVWSGIWSDTTKTMDRWRKESKNVTFSKGEGLPGLAWSSRKPVFFEDVSNDSRFIRADLAKALGIRGGIAIPVLSGREGVYILTFFMFESYSGKEERLVNLVFSTVCQLGELIQRKKLEDEVREHAEKLEVLVKERTQELKRSEERYALAQRAANIGSWDWNITTGALHWSDAIEPLFGFGRGEFGATYEAFLESVHHEDRQFVIDSVNATVKDGKEYAIEHRIVWPDGTVRWISETGDVIRDEKNNAIRMLGVVQDITQRKQMEEELKKHSEQLEELVEQKIAQEKEIMRESALKIHGVVPGQCFLSDSFDKCIKAYTNLTVHGFQGLCIARDDPTHLIKEYGLKKEEIQFISNVPFEDFKIVKNLQDISLEISQHVKEKQSIILLNGIEYLIHRFTFDSVFQMLQEKRVQFLQSKSILLIPFNKGALEPKELSLLETELKTI